MGLTPCFCGYSSVVECQLPKLKMRVRFPLPAPIKKSFLSFDKRDFFVGIFFDLIGKRFLKRFLWNRINVSGIFLFGGRKDQHLCRFLSRWESDSSILGSVKLSGENFSVDAVASKGIHPFQISQRV